MNTQLIFGETYFVLATIYKLHQYTSRGKVATIWTRRVLDKPTVMLYIGKRTLQEGETEGYEDHSEWYSKRRFTAFLFVENANRKPVHVLVSDVHGKVGGDE